MEGTSCIVDAFDDVMDMVMHCSYSIEPFFRSRRREFVVVIEVHSAWIEATSTFVAAEFVGSSSYSVIGKFCKRQPCSPSVLPIVIVDK